MVNKLRLLIAVLSLLVVSSAQGNTHPPLLKPRNTLYHLTSFFRQDPNGGMYWIHGTFAAKLKPFNNYKFHFYRNWSVAPNLVDSWQDVTGTTWATYHNGWDEIEFEIPLGFSPTPGSLMIMCEGNFGNPAKHSQDEIQILADEFPTRYLLGNPSRPGSVVPITVMRPSGEFGAPPQPVSDAFETEWAYDPLKIPLYYKKDGNLSASPGSSWIDAHGVTNMPNVDVVPFTIPSLAVPGVVAVLLTDSYDVGSGMYHEETSGIVRAYPSSSTPTLGGSSISFTSHPSHIPAMISNPLGITGANGDDLKVVAVQSVGDQLLDDIWTRVSAYFSGSNIVTPIRYTDTDNLFQQLDSLVASRGKKITWLEIVGHGNGYYCGGFAVCSLPSQAPKLQQDVQPWAEVYLSGCNTGTCPPGVSISQELANYGVCRTFGAVGFLNECTLSEGSSCPIKARPFKFSLRAQVAYIVNCAASGTGPYAFAEFQKQGNPGQYTCQTQVTLDQNKQLSQTEQLLVSVIQSTIKDMPDQANPEIRLAPDFTVYLAGHRYDFMCDGRVLRKWDPKGPGLVWQVEEPQQTLDALREIWQPKKMQ